MNLDRPRGIVDDGGDDDIGRVPVHAATQPQSQHAARAGDSARAGERELAAQFEAQCGAPHKKRGQSTCCRRFSAVRAWAALPGAQLASFLRRRVSGVTDRFRTTSTDSMLTFRSTQSECLFRSGNCASVLCRVSRLLTLDGARRIKLDRVSPHPIRQKRLPKLEWVAADPT